MTTEEKAKELYGYYREVLATIKYSKENSRVAIMFATHCCDQILVTKNYPTTLHPSLTQWSNACWENVKKELQKIEDNLYNSK